MQPPYTAENNNWLPIKSVQILMCNDVMIIITSRPRLTSRVSLFSDRAVCLASFPGPRFFLSPFHSLLGLQIVECIDTTSLEIG